MAKLPLDPAIVRMLLEAKKYGCVGDALTVASFFSATKGVFVRPKDKANEADLKHAPFKSRESDAFTFLSIWDAYCNADYSRAWCREHFLNANALFEVKNIRGQISDMLWRHGVDVTERGDKVNILKSVAAGLAHNLFQNPNDSLRRGFLYTPVTGTGDGAFIHPGSSVFGSLPDFLVAQSIVRTKKTYMRSCSSVRVEWLPELAPSRFFFGEEILESYTAGEEHAKGKRPIRERSVFRGEESRLIGWQEGIAIPLARARALQKNRIEGADARGNHHVLDVLVPHQREQKGSDLWNEHLVAYLPSGKLCDVLNGTVVPKAGRKYCCAVSFIGPSRQVAFTEFEVFDLGAKSGKQEEKPMVPESAIEALNRRFRT